MNEGEKGGDGKCDGHTKLLMKHPELTPLG